MTLDISSSQVTVEVASPSPTIEVSVTSPLIEVEIGGGAVPGPPGPPGEGGGTIIHSGEPTPSQGVGNPGDYYLDTNDNVLYGPKQEDGTWPTGLVGTRVEALEYTFATPSILWIINHNKNSTAIEVNCYDLSGTQQYDPDLEVINGDTIHINWFFPTAGIARVFV
jgi:hypothetical protein